MDQQDLNRPGHSMLGPTMIIRENIDLVVVVVEKSNFCNFSSTTERLHRAGV